MGKKKGEAEEVIVSQRWSLAEVLSCERLMLRGGGKDFYYQIVMLNTGRVKVMGKSIKVMLIR